MCICMKWMSFHSKPSGTGSGNANGLVGCLVSHYILFLFGCPLYMPMSPTV
ncbi:hypothetical protein BDV29DRAFT_172991, partial [Aspergillus leporis]